MRSRRLLLIMVLVLAAALLAAMAAAAAAQRREKQASTDLTLTGQELPDQVRAAVEELLGAPSDYRVELEMRGEVPIYAVEAVRDGRKVSLEFTDWGQWVEVESEIGFEELPPAMQDVLQRHFPGQAFEKIEEVQLHFYELEVVDQGQEREIRVYPSGRVEVVEEAPDADPDSP